MMRGENNMGYVIVTDSVLDIEESYLLQNNICTVPLSFTLEGCDTVEDDFGRTVPFSSFYQQLRDGKNVTTSQATVGAFASVFEGILQSRRDVVYIGFSSALSGNFQSGCMARDELKDRYPNRVYCVDTFAASGGQTLIVREAVKRKKEGMTAEQLVEWVEEFRTHVVHWFTVDDLMYLHRGGRVSKSSAVVGSLVGIKPEDVLYPAQMILYTDSTRKTVVGYDGEYPFNVVVRHGGGSTVNITFVDGHVGTRRHNEVPESFSVEGGGFWSGTL